MEEEILDDPDVCIECGVANGHDEDCPLGFEADDELNQDEPFI